MERWTKEQMKNMDLTDFAIRILQERENTLKNVYSPLAKNIRKARHHLLEQRNELERMAMYFANAIEYIEEAVGYTPREAAVICGMDEETFNKYFTDDKNSQKEAN